MEAEHDGITSGGSLGESAGHVRVGDLLLGAPGEGDVETVGGAPVTSPVRTALDLLRFADATMAVWELAAISAYIHCLVVHFERAFDRGEELPTLQPWHIAENKWRGARYGMDALVITNRDTDEAWVKDELQLLIDELTPVAADLGCVDELNLVREIIQRGAGYERQRAIYARTGDWKDVVDATCAEMWELTP